MAQNAAAVLVGADGFVLVGDLGATAPTAASTLATLLAGGYEEVGYISTDGVTESNTRTTQALNAWQRNARVRTLTTEGSSSFALTMIETNAAAVELYYGVAPDEDGAIVQNPGAASPRKSFIVGVIDGDQRVLHYIPDGQVTERGDVTYVNNAPIGRQITIGANDNATIGGSVKTWFSSLATEG